MRGDSCDQHRLPLEKASDAPYAEGIFQWAQGKHIWVRIVGGWVSREDPERVGMLSPGEANLPTVIVAANSAL